MRIQTASEIRGLVKTYWFCCYGKGAKVRSVKPLGSTWPRILAHIHIAIRSRSLLLFIAVLGKCVGCGRHHRGSNSDRGLRRSFWPGKFPGSNHYISPDLAPWDYFLFPKIKAPFERNTISRGRGNPRECDEVAAAYSHKRRSRNAPMCANDDG